MKDYNNKNTKKGHVNFIFKEEFLTNDGNISFDNLKKIFNIKYFNYIKKDYDNSLEVENEK